MDHASHVGAPGKENLFRAVKAAVPVPEAARDLGLRPNAAGMLRCPFHPDKNPSLRLYPDHFYCFGCHTHGDVVDLAARIWNLRPIEAAKLLSREYRVADPHPDFFPD